MRDAFLNTLIELADADSDVMLLTGDLGFGVFEKFQQNYRKQYLNVGVAEQNMIGLATGMALEGKKVFTYSIGNFATLRCLEQIRNDAAYHDVNINIVSIGGGFTYGALGMSHHATEDIAIMRALPNVTVVAPTTIWETMEATRSIVKRSGVGYLRLDKKSADDKNGNVGGRFEIGKARVLRQGNDVTLVGTGGIIDEALIAAEMAHKENVECRVLSMHTIKPIDTNAILCAADETKGIISIEEHNITGGLGSAVGEVCIDNSKVPGFFKRIAIQDTYSSVVGSQEYLRNYYELNAEIIYKAIMENLRRIK